MRIERVDSEIQKELSLILQSELKDPRLNDAMISITSVKATKDLKYANVHVSVMGGDKKEVLNVLNSSANFLKGMLFNRLKIRAVPNLTFKLDESYEYGHKIEQILKDINKDK